MLYYMVYLSASTFPRLQSVNLFFPSDSFCENDLNL
jgi:hypothetical protein